MITIVNIDFFRRVDWFGWFSLYSFWNSVYPWKDGRNIGLNVLNWEPSWFFSGEEEEEGGRGGGVVIYNFSFLLVLLCVGVLVVEGWGERAEVGFGRRGRDRRDPWSRGGRGPRSPYAGCRKERRFLLEDDIVGRWVRDPRPREG